MVNNVLADRFSTVAEEIFGKATRMGDLDLIREHLNRMLGNIQLKRRDEMRAAAGEKELVIEKGDFVKWKETKKVSSYIGKALPMFEGWCEEVYPTFYVIRTTTGATRTIKRLHDYNIVSVTKGARRKEA